MEYPGWQADIKTYLIPLLRLEYKNFDKNIIQFSEISKNSRAHKVAISTFRQETKPNKILNKEEILKWLK